MGHLKNEYMIEGYEVYFPYDAYQCQLDYMQKVLYSIKNRKNALLESPTGTGKTMCLLASALAYQKHHLLNNGSSRRMTTLQTENVATSSDTYNLKSDGGMIEIIGIPITGETRGVPDSKTVCGVVNSIGNKGNCSKNHENLKEEMVTPRIIYSSRTHSQLSQVMRELKSSGIGDGFTIELFDSENDNGLNLVNTKSLKQDKSMLKRGLLKGVGLNGKAAKNSGNSKKIFKATILGSRDQLCVHTRISKFKGNTLIKNCRRITKEGKCKYHNNLKQAKVSEVAADIKDIEDLKSLALSSSDSSYFCPYYATREIENVCNVVLLPYNYLLDSITRQNLKMDLRNSILILDEAHNLESVAEEAYSYDLRDIDLALSQKAIQNILEATKLGILENKGKNLGNNNRGNNGRNKRDNDEDDDDDEDEIAFDIEVAISLVTGLHLLSGNLREIPCKIPKPNSNKTWLKVGDLQGETYPGKYIYTLFGSSGFSRDNFQQMDECLTNMINYGQNLVGPGGNVSNLLDVTGVQINNRIGALERFQRCLRLTFNDTTIKNSQWFKVYVHYEIDQYLISDTTNELDETGENRQKKLNLSENEIRELNLADNEYRLYLSFWCFSPAAAISSLASSGVRSMIITSGTLSPLDSLSQQLSCSNVSFDVFLENEHVIDSNKQLMAFTVEKGNGNITRLGSGFGPVQLVGSYEARNNPAYFSALGSVVIDTIRRTPDGVLLFFSSYPLMDQAIRYWNEQGITERLREFKNVFVEPRSSFELGSVLESYMDCINNLDPGGHSSTYSSGFGKGFGDSGSSGGLKRSGSLFIAVCRGKVSEGINFSDRACRGVIIAGLPFPSITDPRVSLKKQYMDESNMDGRQWYNQQAIRAVNQAIGRVVRHKNDYGIIVLADRRFSQFGIYSKLSKWIRSHIKHYPQLEKTQLDGISNFFNVKLGLCINSNIDQHIKSDVTDFNTNTKSVSLCISEKIPSSNLSTEINSVLKLIENNEKEEDRNSNPANTTVNNKSLATPWKKIKASCYGTSTVIRQNQWNSASSATKTTFSTSSSPSKENSNCFTIIPKENVSSNLGITKDEKELFNKTKRILGEKEFAIVISHINQIKKGDINSNNLSIVANQLIPSSNNHSLEDEFINTRKNLALEYLNLIVPLNYRSEFKGIIDNILLNIDLIKDEALVSALEKDPIIYKRSN
ncbi:helicase [Cryptosporidium xiaoi]|uniref:Helicase n=1 Tax=Cryptosporidium xiaoi TaxID=659607 RepID=A0AAV9XV74_9CRYT